MDEKYVEHYCMKVIKFGRFDVEHSPASPECSSYSSPLNSIAPETLPQMNA